MLGWVLDRRLLILLQLPQLFANFKAQSADGLSMAFLIVWLLGDATNLVGKSLWSVSHHFPRAGLYRLCGKLPTALWN